MEARGFGKLKTVYELRALYEKQNLTGLAGNNPYDTEKEAEAEARRLFAKDGGHYFITKITRQVTFRINNN